MTKAGGLISSAARLLFPPKCAVCGIPVRPDGPPLCGACLEKWEREREEFAKEPPPAPPEGIKRAYHLAFYIPSRRGGGTAADNPAADILAYSMKQGKNGDVYPFIARQLCERLYLGAVDGRRAPDEAGLKRLSGCFGLVSYLPRSAKNAAKYGVDQSRSMAKEISRLSGIRFAPLYVNSSKKTQHELSAGERLANMSGLRLKDGAGKLLQETKLIIVDDIVTTGASVSAAAELALEAGAKEVTLLAPFRTKSNQGDQKHENRYPDRA